MKKILLIILSIMFLLSSSLTADARLSNNGKIGSKSRIKQGVDYGSALDFDGATSAVIVPHNANQLLTSGFSFSAWVRPDTIGETNGYIIDKSTANDSADGYRYVVATTDIAVLRIDVAATVPLTNAGSVPTNGSRWTHLVLVTKPDGGTHFFVNGILNGPRNQVGGPLAGIIATTPLTFGNRSNASDRTFDGLLDDIMIWNRPLRDDEAQAIYYRNAIPPTGLVGKWLFNENGGTTAFDTSPNQLNGTVGTSTYVKVPHR